MKPAEFINKLVYWVIMVLEVFLGLRFILQLFSANPDSPFVRWVYENTQPLLVPFTNVFPSARLGRGYTVEFVTLFAIIIYALLGYLIMALVDALTPTTSRK